VRRDFSARERSWPTALSVGSDRDPPHATPAADLLAGDVGLRLEVVESVQRRPARTPEFLGDLAGRQRFGVVLAGPEYLHDVGLSVLGLAPGFDHDCSSLSRHLGLPTKETDRVAVVGSSGHRSRRRGGFPTTRRRRSSPGST